MSLRFTFMTAQDAHTIAQWRYEEPYSIYNLDAASDGYLQEMLEPRSPHYSIKDEQGELIGFANFGTSAQVWGSEVPALYGENNIITIGIGMRPDLTGKGQGSVFLKAILTFTREKFAPDQVRLFVLPFNQRAIHLYEKMGFRRVGSYMQESKLHGKREFIEMSRSLEKNTGEEVYNSFS
ncbi:N-acetyltransferase [Dictyobacter alpinus]|uniref:N-acetyltransferase n=1 Tax=Dictyobacter alpinus TaxID=2014873 RepID=A0A402BH57_9CHLR|nr:GNAT family protein [Dictyobacter alpinus]GCE30676.1 N-acetyltransferase [Dictyobacter alpinus]